MAASLSTLLSIWVCFQGLSERERFKGITISFIELVLEFDPRNIRERF